MKSPLALLILTFFFSACNNNQEKTPAKQKTFEQAVTEYAEKQRTERWSVLEKTSEMDNSKTVQISRDAKNDIETWSGRERPEIIIRCSKKQLEAYVVTNIPAEVTYGDGRPVRLKFDEEKPISQWWFPSTDQKALFAPASSKFVSQAAYAKVLLFEFTPFERAQEVIRFELNGLPEALINLRAAGCHFRYH